jgi:hypothetical protein
MRQTKLSISKVKMVYGFSTTRKIYKKIKGKHCEPYEKHVRVTLH